MPRILVSTWAGPVDAPILLWVPHFNTDRQSCEGYILSRKNGYQLTLSLSNGLRVSCSIPSPHFFQVTRDGGVHLRRHGGNGNSNGPLPHTYPMRSLLPGFVIADPEELGHPLCEHRRGGGREDGREGRDGEERRGRAGHMPRSQRNVANQRWVGSNRPR